jgi:hypothetical protein
VGTQWKASLANSSLFLLRTACQSCKESRVSALRLPARRPLLHRVHGPSLDPTTVQLTLGDDVRLLKTGLLYADRVRLASVGSSLTLSILAVTKSDPDRQLNFLERHFRENVSRYNPEAAAKMLEFIRLYRLLRATRVGRFARKSRSGSDQGRSWQIQEIAPTGLRRPYSQEPLRLSGRQCRAGLPILLLGLRLPF